MFNEIKHKAATILEVSSQYTPIRAAALQLLVENGQRIDAGWDWWMHPGGRKSRFHWQATRTTTFKETPLIVTALTDSTLWGWGSRAGEIGDAMITLSIAQSGLEQGTKVEVQLPPLDAVMSGQVTVGEVYHILAQAFQLPEILKTTE